MEWDDIDNCMATVNQLHKMNAKKNIKIVTEKK